MPLLTTCERPWTREASPARSNRRPGLATDRARAGFLDEEKQMRRTSWTAAVAAALLGLTACGGGQGAGPQQAETGEFTGEYDGPAVTLSYWNGFTGADGPFMDELVRQFQEENDNITIESNTIEWTNF